MVHPTCAPARHPNVSHSGENPLHKSGDDLAALSRQATAEIGALNEAHRAAACVHNLLLHAPGLRSAESNVSLVEIEALLALIKAEFERRLHAAKATIALMHPAE